MKKSLIGAALIMLTLQFTGCGGGDSSTPPPNTQDNGLNNLVNDTPGAFDNNGSISVHNAVLQNLNTGNNENSLVINWKRSGTVISRAPFTELAVRDANETNASSFAYTLFQSDMNDTETAVYAYSGYDGEYGQKFMPRSSFKALLTFFFLKDNHYTYLVERGWNVSGDITEKILGTFTSDGNGQFIFTPKQ